MILVDEQDAWLLEAVRWNIQKVPSSDLKYAVTNHQTDCGRRVASLHRLIAEAPEGMLVDHINGNGLDCRRANLRLCSHAENMRNRRVSKSNKLGIKGVWYEEGRFRAEIRADGVKHKLGSFRTADEAAEAYRLASQKLHGAFSRTA